jgi:succinyl-diaminopimelate desuccinylase
VTDTRERDALSRIDVDEIVADTCELIRGRGENPGDTEEDTVRRIAAICRRIGASVHLQEVAPGRSNLHAAIGPVDGPALLFLGHSDVVPAGDGWTGDPFQPRVGDGVVIGRGASDMKGGIAAALAAMRAVAAVQPEVRLELLCTVDEEDRATGVHAALAATPPRAYLACVVAEPTNLEVVIGCRGATNLVVEIDGAPAHAGRPTDGASAIYAASRIVEAVRRSDDEFAAGPHDALLGRPTWNVGTIVGGTGTSVVPGHTTITIDRRTMPGEDPVAILESLIGDVRSDIADIGIPNAERITVRGHVDMVMPGFRTATDDPVARIASRALRDLGAEGALTGWTAACEGGFIAGHHGAPTIILGPGDINNQAHQPDERVDIDDLATAARAYTLIALRLASHPDHHVATEPSRSAPTRSEVTT